MKVLQSKDIISIIKEEKNIGLLENARKFYIDVTNVGKDKNVKVVNSNRLVLVTP